MLNVATNMATNVATNVTTNMATKVTTEPEETRRYSASTYEQEEGNIKGI